MCSKNAMNSIKNPHHISWLDYLFILRPMLFFPGWSTMLAGYFIHDNHRLWLLRVSAHELNYTHIIILITGFSLLMGSTFILNQLKDIQTDRENRKLFIIANGYISKKTAFGEAVILAIFAQFLGFLIKPIVSILFIFFFIITGILYNYHPFRLKDRPWGSLFANIAMGWLAFAIGWVVQNAVSWQIVRQSISYLLFNTALYLFTVLPDREGDRKAIKETLAVIYGIKPVIISAFSIYLAGFSYTLLMKDMQALVFYLCSLPFFLHTIFSLKVASAVKTLKFGILFFALAVCLKLPLYLLLMITGFYATRIYYKKRFHFNYPNFSGS
jgi:4-hydroxybenzoate polyprenyltransferase